MNVPYTLHLVEDSILAMRDLPDNSVDAVVTDPPYGIGFMGKAWDGKDIEQRAAGRRAAASTDPHATEMGGHKSVAAAAGQYNLTPAAMRAFQEFSREWAVQALRVLKPGGHLLSFASARTYHRMASGIEDAGFEIRDQIMWVFGSGFPKSHNGEWGGTALKPAHEPIVMARKPLVGTVAANVLEHGTGALNIDGCRVGYELVEKGRAGRDECKSNSLGKKLMGGETQQWQAGRWPANLIHDGSSEVVAGFPGATDTNAARFFYCAKASREDRNEGLASFPEPAVRAGATMGDRERADWEARNGNFHPTVKPTALMSYLCRLVTPPGGLVLDPFMGSGSTGKAAVLEGFRFIGMEREKNYMGIATARVAFGLEQRQHATRQSDLFAEA